MELSSLTDENLLSGYCRTGREELFEELVNRHAEQLLGWLIGFTGGDFALAEDARQMAWVNVWRFAPKFRGRCPFKTWLYAIAKNTAVVCVRKNRRYRHGFTIEQAPEGMFVYVNEEPAIELPPSFNLVQVIAELSPKLRAVSMLRYLDSLTYKAISQRLGIELGTVRSRLNRAKAIIAQRPEFANQE